MAFTKSIEKNSTDSHQTSPAYVLTFTRWRNRDTVNYNLESSTSTRTPLVVVNDATSLIVNYSKSSPTPTFSCMLRQGDLNYMTAIAPGDYVVVNMVNWKSKAMEIRERALNQKPINKVDDGFKGLFKIQDVNMILGVGPDGGKQYYVQVTARGFDEFNNILYFNPAIASEDNRLLFLNNFKNFTDLIKKKETNNVQNLCKEVIKRAIGVGIKQVAPKDTSLNQIPAYRIPEQIGNLLGRKAQFISEVNNYYTGIWDPGPVATGTKNPNEYSGFASFFKDDAEFNFFRTGKELPGARAIAVGDFQSVNVWSLLTDYSNPVINESYTCYRVSKDGKSVFPTVVIRQKPFTTRHYENFAKGFTTPHTKFLDLPRWKISPDLITNLNIGRSDSGRINFCQIFTRSQSNDPKFDAAKQIEVGNFAEDTDDVIRNGRKPFIATCNYDYAGTDTEHRAQKWAKLVADWVFNGHLKMNGTIESVGIVDPICVGDNLELDNIVYHIETISHNMSIDAAGFNSFRTGLSLSMGVSESSTKDIPVYAEMDHTDTKTRREDDQKNERLLPGFSDTQDLPSRVGGEEVTETRQATFTNPISSNKGKKRVKPSIADIRKKDDN
tara:strand:- start:14621 stop:16450 length:1830 start_codon:yes stop_codon:yes gene_type:complete